MRQFRLRKSTDPKEGSPSIKERVTKNWRLIFTLSIIVLIALILRVFFAYDYAVSGGFALSGGSNSAYHLHVIEYIMETGKQMTMDPTLNYPFGETNINPFLMDWTFAALAKVVTLFGVSTTAAATGTLVFATAILGALTCIPIYYLGRAMFSHNAGLIAALLYAICAVVINNTVLSNGTEAAFYGFFFVIMVYFLYKAVKACTNESFVRKKGELKGYTKEIYGKNRQAFKYGLIAGILFAIVALSWNGFGIIVIMLSAMMITQVVIDRIRNRDPTSVMSVYAITLLVGMIIALPFYLAQGLWSLVFSGPFLTTILAVIIAVVLSETKGRPWLLVIPVVAVVVIAFFAILYFAAPGMYSDMVHGNSIYLDPTYASLVAQNSSTSLSMMAAYYGWLTMWLPYILIAFMAYKLPEKIGSVTHMFILMWTVAMVAISWTGSNNVFLAAPAYVLGGGAVLAWIIKKADIRSYFAAFKGSGFHFKSTIRNIIKPAPLLTILMAVFLVGAPNALYAIDASVSSNEKAASGNDGYIGALGYYVRDDSDWKMNDVWNTLSSEEKSGALVSWWDYSADAASMGGFQSVAGSNGAGAAAASNILLADDQGSMAAMATRLIDYYGIDNLQSTLVPAYMSSAEFTEFKKIFDDPSSQINTIIRDPTTYGKLNSSLTAENAMYIAAVHYLCNIANDGGLSQMEMIDLYDSVRNASGKSINYIAVSSGMFPLYYGDGSMFSTLAYMNNYYLDSNGAPTQFYSYNSDGYCNYTDAMYNSVVWRTYIGPSPSDYGYSSALSMLNALALSDGSDGTVAQPGFGLANYQVVYWKVLYNPSNEATNSSDGWVEMFADDAQAKQAEAGGLINYVSGLPVVLEYRPASEYTELSGTVKDNTGAGVKGVRVAVFDSDGIQKATTFTDENGAWSLYAPAAGTINVAVGSSSMRGGLVIAEEDLSDPDIATKMQNITVNPAAYLIKVFYDDSSEDADNLVKGDLSATIEGTVHGKTATISNVTDATFNFDTSYGLIPDKYKITIKDKSGNEVCTGTYEATKGRGTAGDSVQIVMLLSTSTISLNITDEYGNALTTDKTANTGYVKLTNTNGNYSRVVAVEAGKAEVKVLPGTYIASITDEDGNQLATGYELFNATVTVTSGNTGTITAKAQQFATITGVTTPTGATSIQVSNGASDGTVIVPVSSGSTTIRVPAGLATNTYYISTLYNSSGMKIAYTTVNLKAGDDQTGIALSAGVDAFEYSKILKTSGGTIVAGTVNFYGADTFFSAMASSDGSITAWLPAGTYVMHAVSSNASYKEAYIGDLSISGTNTGGIIQLVAAKTMTVKALTSTDGTQNIPYVPIKIGTSNGLMISTATNGSGTFAYLVPADLTYTAKALKEIGAGVTSFVLQGIADPEYVSAVVESTTASLNATFRTSDPTLYDGNIIFNYDDGTGTLVPFQSSKIEIKSTYQSTYSIYSTNGSGLLELPNGKLAVGDYNVRILRTDGYYYSGTMSLRINNADVTITAVKMVKVILSGDFVKDDDKVTITALDDEKGTYLAASDSSSADKSIWYLQYGKTFQIKVTDKDGKNVWYYYAYSTGTDPTLIDGDNTLLVKKLEGLEISGYVGYYGSGTVDITFKDSSFDSDPDYPTAKYPEKARKYVATVSNGKYTAFLPMVSAEDQKNYTFKAYIGKYTDDSVSPSITKYEYISDVRPVALQDFKTTKVVNMVVTTSDPKSPKDSNLKVVDDIYNLDDLLSDRTVTFKLTITATKAEFKSLFLSGGSGWEEIHFYSDSLLTNEIDLVNLAGGLSADVWVKATLKDDIAYDDPSLSIILKDAAGSNLITYEAKGLNSAVIDASEDPVDPLEITESVTIGRGETDKMSDTESNMAVLVKNDSPVSRKFTMSIQPYTSENWMVVITSSDGNTIEPVGGTMTFTVKGMSEMTVYIKLVSTFGQSVPLPSDIKVEVEATNMLDDANIHQGDDAIITGAVATINMAPHEASVDIGGNDAAGPNIFNSAGSMPIYLWALIAIVILAFALIVWLGMKRGVFSRKK